MADAIRARGSEPALQLNHAGRQTHAALIDGAQPVGPSAIPTGLASGGPPPRALTAGEIEGLVVADARAAGRAVAAGFRVIALHFAHGYLVSQFLSPQANHRDDRYGGSLDNRMRFGRDIVSSIRAEVGVDVAIDVQINGRDFVPQGIEITEAITFARALAEAGADAFNVSGGVYGSDPFSLLLPFDGFEFLAPAAAVRAATGLPVTGVGNLRFPHEAARAVAIGCCDLVGVTRAVLADPDWARKALGDDPRPLRPCVGTLDGCSERVRRAEPASCQVNPEVGRESRPRPRPVSPRRLLVVGGGPAGAECAIRAADTGHQVVLLDRATRLGGALRLAAVPPGGAPFGWLADYYEQELSGTTVDVRLGTACTPELVTSLRPHHVVLATGAVQEPPAIAGVELGTTVPDEVVLSDGDSDVWTSALQRGKYVR